MDHNYTIFGAQLRALHTHYTWLHTHPVGYARRFITGKVATLAGWELVLAHQHPLGNIN